MRSLQGAFIAMGCALYLSAPVHADPTETFEVTAVVEEGCLVSGTLHSPGTNIGALGELNFGSASALSTELLSAELVTDAGFELTCTPGVEVTMQVNGGGNSSGGLRHLAHLFDSEASPIAYRLYSDAAFTNEISAGTPITIPRSGDEQVTISMFGQVLLSGDHRGGSYHDELTVTIEW
ncbi:MAG: spore coat U domain-containing protein [Idiomarina sp.]|nr:spore coat U domain-containing protein [Idiomarina sp.]